MKGKMKNGLIALFVTVLMGSVSACDLFEAMESASHGNSLTESVSSETSSVEENFDSVSQEEEIESETPSTSDAPTETPEQDESEENSAESTESEDSEGKEGQEEIIPPVEEDSTSENTPEEDDGTIELPEIKFD